MSVIPNPINPTIASQLAPYPLKLYVTLVCAMKPDGLKISIAELATLAGMSERSVITHTAALEKQGIIAVTRNKQGNHADVNIYRFTGEVALPLSGANHAHEDSASGANHAPPLMHEMQRKAFNDNDDNSIDISISSKPSVANDAHEGHDPAIEGQDNFASQLEAEGVFRPTAKELAASITPDQWREARAIGDTRAAHNPIGYAIAMLRNSAFAEPPAAKASVTTEAGRTWIDADYTIHYEPAPKDYFAGEFGMFVEGGPRDSPTQSDSEMRMKAR